MLTTKEIKKELDAGREVELECIDTEGFLGKESNTYLGWKKVILSLDRIIATSRSYNDDASMLKDARGTCITDSQLKYFRIKRPAPTFDDLIDVVVQAYKDKVINWFRVKSSCVNIGYNGNPNIKAHDVADDIAAMIEIIDYLYTKEFVIESNEDIIELLRNDEIELTNGNVLICLSAAYEVESRWAINAKLKGLTNSKHTDYCLTLLVLKGAKVTRKRGEAC